MLKQALFISLCLPLLFACAWHRQSEQHAPINNFIPVYRTGMILEEVVDGLLVSDFDSDLMGKASVVQRGDVIVSVNGTKRSNREFMQLMNKNRGEDVLFTVKRNGHILDYAITPRLYFRLPPSTYKLHELLDIDGQNVKVAVVVTDIRNEANGRSYAWEESMRHQLQETVQSYLLNNFSDNDKFSLADNSRLNNVLDDYALNMTGLTSDAARERIGAMTGATHLLAVTLVRHPKRVRQKESCEDDQTASLMEIQSGQILASDNTIQECK